MQAGNKRGLFESWAGASDILCPLAVVIASTAATLCRSSPEDSRRSARALEPFQQRGARALSVSDKTVFVSDNKKLSFQKSLP